MVIGLSSNATAGKDTLFGILKDLFSQVSINLERFALADDLKADLNQFTLKYYGISSYTKDIKEKELIRPLMVAHGKCKRLQTNGKYWTSLLFPKIEQSLKEGNLPCITDIRYDEFEEDEINWLKNKLNGKLVYISRIFNNKEIPPANEDESRNQFRIIKKSDFKLTWPTTDDNMLRVDYVKLQLKELINQVCQAYQKYQIIN